MEMEDDCIIIEDTDEEADAGDKDRKEVFVISDSEETNDVPTLESREPLNQDNNLENPMYCEDDLTKSEESEELQKDVLLQRLKKKLLQAKSLKEQQVDLPFTSLPGIFIFHQRSELSVFALQPPQPPDTDCQDSVNFPQNLKILNEFPDINFCHVDLLRNVNHQFCKNNNNKFEDLSIFCNSLTL